ncbi:MAG: dynamin family protein [Pseudomonadota bacterium]
MDHDKPSGDRNPCIALMGEFSAGKSTLSNLLIGASPLPTKVTATQLPPVRISNGEGAPFRVDLEGNEHPVDLEHLEDVPLAETSHIRLFASSEILELCDLIDMPGISDPNMDAAVWQRVLPEADGVIWCTHATQAWRQSEAAVWETMPEELKANSVLLLTRIDKLTNERDRRRVVQRVRHEAEDLFAGVFPISLIEAIGAGEDEAKWNASGAGAFAEAFIGILNQIAAQGNPRANSSVSMSGATGEAAPSDHGRIVPRRVKVGEGSAARQRPSASEVPLSAAVLQRQARGL